MKSLSSRCHCRFSLFKQIRMTFDSVKHCVLPGMTDVCIYTCIFSLWVKHLGPTEWRFEQTQLVWHLVTLTSVKGLNVAFVFIGESCIGSYTVRLPQFITCPRVFMTFLIVSLNHLILCTLHSIWGKPRGKKLCPLWVKCVIHRPGSAVAWMYCIRMNYKESLFGMFFMKF